MTGTGPGTRCMKAILAGCNAVNSSLFAVLTNSCLGCYTSWNSRRIMTADCKSEAAAAVAVAGSMTHLSHLTWSISSIERVSLLLLLLLLMLLLLLLLLLLHLPNKVCRRLPNIL
ncbi:hypothetical protein BpHYR1_025590 [Brachionus plicatilis]|uniref:Uncharacterized protein n=1 Tax=Brachionus plicatilis TaxID=10195 RepID=A0A3M7S4R0_BRAPC|nr:hypothetical protein BpHYR1_025590 [Brachionus plicatilis]